MRSADQGLQQLQAALQQTGAEPLSVILRSLDLGNVSQIHDLETLNQVVAALEAKVEHGARP